MALIIVNPNLINHYYKHETLLVKGKNVSYFHIPSAWPSQPTAETPSNLPAGCAGAEILIDHGIAEYWADGGLRYGAAEIGGDALGGRIEAYFPVLSARLYEFASRA